MTTSRVSFAQRVGPLHRRTVGTVQINVGKRCNQACVHCHVEAGPKRTEQMNRVTAERVMDLVEAEADRVSLVDITGGAPELNANFRWLVQRSRALDLPVMDRCNLTVLLEPGQEDTAAFLADHAVQITASLPCYGPKNVDAQRGRGVFERSVAALQQLNALGYGTDLELNLVYNPGGSSLPPDQAALEADYRTRLYDDFGIVFTRLFTLANMPIRRFQADLERHGQADAYRQRLVEAFNPATVDGLMCRDLISVGWDGRLYDCDFNQMLDMQVADIWQIERLTELARVDILTDSHCFGCTAGSGSSCGGALL